MSSDLKTPKTDALALAVPPKLIGLSGYARSGKDTVGEIITKRYGHQIVSVSNLIREFLWLQDLYLPSGQRLNDIVEELGWEEARVVYPYVRELQQRTGTECARGLLGDEVWTNAVMRGKDDGNRYVFTSVRYPNEADKISALGGKVFRVERPGVAAINSHVSDHAMDKWPFTDFIHNSGTLEDLVAEVERVVVRVW